MQFYSSQVPVLLIIFNRSDTALQVVNQLRSISVNRLYIYCDGPREEKEGEIALLNEVRQTIVQGIDWPCKLITSFKEKNVGPRLAIGNAIKWFFEYEEEGIILEHDCVPSLSFFSFCKNLLEYYRHDERIMHISGDNFQFGKHVGDGSYYFSKITHIWGFATWKRAWKHYDVDMKHYPEFKRTRRINDIIFHKRSVKFWNEIFDKTYHKQLQTWDYQWTFAMWCANGLAVLPNKNLVSNVGFDELALNTTNPNDRLAGMETLEMNEVKHPAFVIHNQEADAKSMDEVFYPGIIKYGLSRLKGLNKFFK